MRVADVLSHKGSSVVTVAPEDTVADAVAVLARRRIGALVVSADGRSVGGIVSERDVVRALEEFGPEVLGLPVGRIMTAEVHTCTPQDPIGSLAKTMTDHRFRHMPVTVDGVLSGIMSIGDVVKSRVDELETEHDQLVDYISTVR